jgi:hypothetical protein
MGSKGSSIQARPRRTSPRTADRDAMKYIKISGIPNFHAVRACILFTHLSVLEWIFYIHHLIMGPIQNLSTILPSKMQLLKFQYIIKILIASFTNGTGLAI